MKRSLRIFRQKKVNISISFFKSINRKVNINQKNQMKAFFLFIDYRKFLLYSSVSTIINLHLVSARLISNNFKSRKY